MSPCNALLDAFRENLITGFVNGEGIENLSNGFCQHVTFHGHLLVVTDRCTKTNPSIGYTVISYDHINPHANDTILWGMNYFDQYYDNSFVARTQVLDFLREAIVANDTDIANIPLRGKNRLQQNLSHGFLAYEIGNNPYNLDPFHFSFAKFSIIERVYFYHIVNHGLSIRYTVYESKINGGYLDSITK